MATTFLGLRYPSPTEFLGQVATHIRLLAEDLDAAHAHDAVEIARDYKTTVTVNGAAVYQFPGAVDHLQGWTYASGVFTYTGTKSRPYLIDMSVDLVISGPVQGYSAALLLDRNATRLAQSDQSLTLTTAAGATEVSGVSVRCSITTVAVIAPGDTLTASVLGVPTAVAGFSWARIYPIGPRRAA